LDLTWKTNLNLNLNYPLPVCDEQEAVALAGVEQGTTKGQ